MKKGLQYFSLIAAVLLISGCSSKNPPVDKIANVEMAINRAHDSKAERYAPLELKLAEEKFEKIKVLMREKDYENAADLADKALADARLAEAKARSSKTKQMASELANNIDALKAEINRINK